MKAFVEKNKHMKAFFSKKLSTEHMKAFVEKNKHNMCLAKASAKKFMCL